MLRQLLVLGIACGLLFMGMTPLAAQSGDCDPEPAMAMISRAPDGTPGNAESSMFPMISGNGRYIAFFSDADNLVPDDTNEEGDVFIYDRLTCQNRLASVNAEGEQGNGISFPLKLSTDGRYLLMVSRATNFDETVTDGSVFLRDMQLNTLTYIAPYGYWADMSGDGRYVVYEGEDGVHPIGSFNSTLYLYDRVLDDATRIMPDAEVHEDSPQLYFLPAISTDGNYIAFTTSAVNLVEDAVEGWGGVYLYERMTGEITFISPLTQAELVLPMPVPSLSADGRYITFISTYWGYVPPDTWTIDIYFYDRIAEEMTQVSQVSPSALSMHAMSADGRYITYTAGHSASNAFMYDRLADITRQISIDTSGHPIEFDRLRNSHTVSGDGRFVVFLSADSALTSDGLDRRQVFLTDWQALTGYIPEDAPQRNVYATATPTLTWSPITWAAAYEIQIDDGDDFSGPVYHNATLTTAEVITPELPNGVYHWRVRAQRPNGIWSNWSAVDSFVVDVP